MTFPIANTILTQLGGNRFIAMTGARDLLARDRGLQFRLPANFARDGINRVQIDLDASDRYSVRFLKIRGLNVKECGAVDGVYADQLRATFTQRTGLDTHL